MTTLNPYVKQYKKNQVETASPEKILILLYDGAINFLNKAKICLEEGDDDEFHKKMTGCKNIIIEFMETLDLEQGGDWALTLYNLYKYLRKVVIKSDVSKNVDGINEVLKHLSSLRETWIKAIEIAQEERRSQGLSGVETLKTESGAICEYYDGDGDRYETDSEEDEDEEEEDEDGSEEL